MTLVVNFRSGSGFMLVLERLQKNKTVAVGCRARRARRRETGKPGVRIITGHLSRALQQQLVQQQLVGAGRGSVTMWGRASRELKLPSGHSGQRKEEADSRCEACTPTCRHNHSNAHKHPDKHQHCAHRPTKDNNRSGDLVVQPSSGSQSLRKVIAA